MENIGVAYSATLANLTEDAIGFKNKVDEVHTEIVHSAEDFNKNLDTIAAKADTTFTNIKQNIEPINAEMAELNKQTNEFLSMIAGDTGQLDKGVMKLQEYNDTLAGLKDQASTLASTLKITQDQKDAALQEAANYKTQYEAAQATLQGIANGTLDRYGNPIQTGGGGGGGADDATAYSIANAIWVYGS